MFYSTSLEQLGLKTYYLTTLKLYLAALNLKVIKIYLSFTSNITKKVDFLLAKTKDYSRTVR